MPYSLLIFTRFCVNCYRMPVVFETNLAKDQQKFFINGEQWPGIQSVQFGYDQNFDLPSFLGQKDVRYLTVLNGPKIGSLSTNGVLNSNDIYLPYTGNISCNALILDNVSDGSLNFSINNAYLTSYSHKYSIEQQPSISLNFQTFGNIGVVPVPEKSATEVSELAAAQNKSTLLLKTFHVGCVILSPSFAMNYRPMSYDINISCPRQPIYKIGSTTPTVIQKYPIEINVNFQVEIPTFDSYKFADYPTNKRIEDIVISLLDLNGSVQQSYNFNQMTLRSQSIGVSTDSSTAINFSYSKLLL